MGFSRDNSIIYHLTFISHCQFTQILRQNFSFQISYLLNEQGEPLVFDSSMETSNFSIDEDGRFWYRNADKTITELGVSFGVVQFNNPTGLYKLSNSLLQVTEASGEPMLESENGNLKASKVHSGYLEASNVETVDEMVNLIVAQRAYEMNSKVIQASDQMLQQANNLRS